MIKNLNIKQICADKGITQADLAGKINITAQSLSRIISTNNTSSETLQKIASVLDVSVDDLFKKEPNSFAASVKFISDLSKIKIAKIINIVAPTDRGEMKVGSMIYTRPVNTTDYRMKPSESDVFNPFEDYPKQSSFPSDVLDALVLKSVKEIYPNSVVYNKLIALNVDINYLDALQNFPTVDANIYLNPLVDYDTMISQKRTEYTQFIFPVKIYTEFKNEYLRTFFSANYDLSVEDIINDNSMHIKFS